MNNRKLQVWLPLIFSLVMIAGMFYGFRLHQQTGTQASFFKKERSTALQEALDLINLKYVDKVHMDSLQAGAMQEMMSELDPHSVYIPAMDLSEANEDIIGNFEGIGIEFNIFNDTVNVLYVVPDGPSDKAGLQVGDRILKVGDSSITNRRFGSDQIKKLILDLRGNGGGLLIEAIDIADDFLDEDKLIVYTEGENVKRREYKARRDGLFEQGELVLLIDELAASASEVLAGALQDWDRATIIGRRSFGKGLVQEQYTLSDGSAIRLTVARYYTPLGRSIQRSYANGKEVYMDELFERHENGQLQSADSNKFVKGQTYVTKKGKKVYGGGGIMPDIFVPIDTSRLQASVTKLYLEGTFNNFVYQYYSQRLPLFAQYKSPADFNKRFNNTNDAWNKLVQFAKKDSINLQNIPAADREAIEQRLKAYLARFRWRNQGFFEVLNNSDPTIIKAMEVIGK